MNKICCSIIITLSLLISPCLTMAEDTIDLLMQEKPLAPVPSKQVKRIDRLNGKVFFNGQFYSGSLEVMNDDKGLYVVNKVPFQRYLEAAVAAETGREREIEAIKAQAVISRTIAVARTRYSEENFHISSGISRIMSEDKDINPYVVYSVRATDDEVLTHNDMPIKAFYHETCSGRTELPEELWGESYSYLKSVDCNINNAPYDRWQKRVNNRKIEKALGIADLRDISIESNTSTGRVKTLRITSGNKSTLLPVMEFRKLMGYTYLQSNQFIIDKSGDHTIFMGKGTGHGVGLCQRGALEMAKQGKTYREILAHYFPGAEIQKVDYLKFQASKSKK